MGYAKSVIGTQGCIQFLGLSWLGHKSRCLSPVLLREDVGHQFPVIADRNYIE